MMPNFADWFTSLVTGWVAASPWVAVLLVLIGLDIITGLVAAVVSGKMTSRVSWSGMLRKVSVLSLVAMGLALEFIYPDIPWGRIIAMFFCVTESISIMENAGRSGVPLPKSIVDALQRLREPSGTGGAMIQSVEVDTLNVKSVHSESGGNHEGGDG